MKRKKYDSKYHFSFFCRKIKPPSKKRRSDIPTEVVELLIKYDHDNKQDDSEWVVPPVTHFEAYFDNTNFSRKWWNKVPDSIIVKQKQCYGVCGYGIRTIFYVLFFLLKGC